LSRFKLALQRFYLALEPTYRPFLVNMYNLATWKDWNQSCLWCIASRFYGVPRATVKLTSCSQIFWLLWLSNLLITGLLVRLLWSLFRRRLLPYPTLQDLRQRRREVARAEKFGERISDRLSSTSKFGVKEAWKIAKDLRSWSNSNVNITSAPSKYSNGTAEVSGEHLPLGEVREGESEAEWAIQDLQRLLLLFVNEVADFHERARK
jgi:GRAM domain-containing protein 4